MSIGHASSLRCRLPERGPLPPPHFLVHAGARCAAGNHGVHFENLVFAGGGNRCFWQAGFWSVVAATLSLKPSRVVAVSAGSAIACALFSGSFSKGFARYKRAMAKNNSNLHLRNLLREQPVFPHGNNYREAILACIDQRALLRLHAGPEISVLISFPPRWASPRIALLLGMIATGIDAWGNKRVHSTVGQRIGFRPLFIPVRECSTPESLADLIMASSCTPPLTPQSHRNGIALLDGGLVSNVPTDGLAEAQGETLVLLTRQFAALPSIPGRTYVQPSRPIPVAAWDYTNDAALQATFDLGRHDGERFCALRGV
jgi:predicted acylesterase/phospholipase RssA